MRANNPQSDSDSKRIVPRRRRPFGAWEESVWAKDAKAEDMALRVRNRFDQLHHLALRIFENSHFEDSKICAQDRYIMLAGFGDVADLVHELARLWDPKSRPVR